MHASAEDDQSDRYPETIHGWRTVAATAYRQTVEDKVVVQGRKTPRKTISYVD